MNNDEVRNLNENIMIFNENKIKALEMIQGIINRLASNSFALKAIISSILAGAIAIYKPDNSDCYNFNISLTIVVFVFWYLDSVYLKLEREYRRLYEYTVNIKMDTYNKDIGLDIKNNYLSELYNFSRNKKDFKNSIYYKNFNILLVMISWTESPLYLSLMIICWLNRLL